MPLDLYVLCRQHFLKLDGIIDQVPVVDFEERRLTNQNDVSGRDVEFFVTVTFGKIQVW